VRQDVNDFMAPSLFTRLAKTAIDAVTPHFPRIALDLGFLLCGYDEEELPERLLGVVRLHHVDLQQGAIAGRAMERAEACD
jgi:hypothetical protein